MIIKHTPKDISYNIIGFREKNKDEISKIILKTLNESKDTVISRLCESRLTNNKFLS